jgi:hypothetical protein
MPAERAGVLMLATRAMRGGTMEDMCYEGLRAEACVD